jgi:hypothetical protein
LVPDTIEVRLAPPQENARPPGPPDMSTTGQGSGSHVYVSGENEPAEHDSVASLGVKPDRHWVVQLSLWRIEKLSEQGPLPATVVTVTPAGFTSTNYDIAFAAGSVTTDKAPLTTEWVPALALVPVYERVPVRAVKVSLLTNPENECLRARRRHK